MNFNPLFSITNDNVSVLTHRLFHKRKEKFDMIVEPFQAILQICFLAFCPIGTKIAIQDNLLRIQLPCISQGIMRWYYSDNKDDLYYLFNVFRRFIVYYDFLNHSYKSLMNLILYLAKQGLNNLMFTYQKTEKISLLHTLELYKCILDKPSLIMDSIVDDHGDDGDIGGGNGGGNGSGGGIGGSGGVDIGLNNKKNKKNKNTNGNGDGNVDRNGNRDGNVDRNGNRDGNVDRNGNGDGNVDRNGNRDGNVDRNGNGNIDRINKKLQPIDEIFSQIAYLYTNEEYVIIYNTLLILEHKYKNQSDKSLLVIQGLNDILHGTFENIRGWINEKIAF